ncbi:nucleotide exchange factor GrpE [Paracraurococcus ruber]|uniref:Protein GrpE n=1 Tax=Paracraurococcus ruber TaxID=77675 RepID=A0ABS1CRG2_9PROT|nr:nucleotide exchange factor GrpE [Paracraurococcus ruber]MBK1656930.1 nucleotide exchange factor GrpE [Paracraurococcus ruber]TDG33279.1 nucleotide exchange factor GrpE [Paracraurococcus ruber]
MTDPAETPPDTAPAEQTKTDQAGATPAQDPTPEERIAALEAEVTQFRDRWLRAEAEMQNLRSRTQREVTDARQYAIQKFAGDVVEAAQNLRRGLEALPAKQDGEPELLTKLRDGFEGVERSFVGILERHGIARQDAQGKPFDPELHQAMAEQPAPAGVAPGTVLQAWTPAWTLNGRLLKPAMVVVAAGGTTTA